MSQPRVKETAKHRLIVEGRDDKWAILALTARHSWDWENPTPDMPYVRDADGVENALADLPVAAKTYDRFGIVLDADLEARGRWQSVRNHVLPFGFSLPERPESEGTVAYSGKRRFGAWLMPDNGSEGMLEDFLAFLLPNGDPCWPLANEVCTTARSMGAPFAAEHHAKAQVHTWLAWRKEPGQPFGTAITATTFRHDTPQAQAFVAWMKRLFLEP